MVVDAIVVEIEVGIGQEIQNEHYGRHEQAVVAGGFLRMSYQAKFVESMLTAFVAVAHAARMRR